MAPTMRLTDYVFMGGTSSALLSECTRGGVSHREESRLVRRVIAKRAAGRRELRRALREGLPPFQALTENYREQLAAGDW